MNPEDDKDDDREEARATHRRHHSCSDGMCGAEDCKRCRPGWSWDEEAE